MHVINIFGIKHLNVKTHSRKNFKGKGFSEQSPGESFV